MFKENMLASIKEDKISRGVKKIFSIFSCNGVDLIRLVGGSVRDLLLQKEVCDFDFATKLHPDEVCKILNSNQIRFVPTGAKFGTITAILDPKYYGTKISKFEITTLRRDLQTDGRHCNPEFVSDYFLDARRRDFTINALYMDEKLAIHDYFGGIDDLREKRVRFIGDAELRIAEDYLRILRFFRFTCYYASEIDTEGLYACIKLSDGIKLLSAERIANELLRILMCEDSGSLSQTLDCLENSGIRSRILSLSFRINALRNLLSFCSDAQIDCDPLLKLATLYSDTDELVSRLRLSNKQKRYLKFLSGNTTPIGSHGEDKINPMEIMLAFYPNEQVADYYLLNCALGRAEFSSEELIRIKKFECPEFPLSASDLIASGTVDARISSELKRARIHWATHKFKPIKTDLLSFLNEPQPRIPTR